MKTTLALASLVMLFGLVTNTEAQLSNRTTSRVNDADDYEEMDYDYNSSEYSAHGGSCGSSCEPACGCGSCEPACGCAGCGCGGCDCGGCGCGGGFCKLPSLFGGGGCCCRLAPATCVQYPRCMSFRPCSSRCCSGPCCATIFHEMACDLKGLFGSMRCMGGCNSCPTGPIGFRDSCCDGCGCGGGCGCGDGCGCGSGCGGGCFQGLLGGFRCRPECCGEPACGCEVCCEPACGCNMGGCGCGGGCLSKCCGEPACGCEVCCEPGCGCAGCGCGSGCASDGYHFEGGEWEGQNGSDKWETYDKTEAMEDAADDTNAPTPASARRNRSRAPQYEYARPQRTLKYYTSRGDSGNPQYIGQEEYVYTQRQRHAEAVMAQRARVSQPSLDQAEETGPRMARTDSQIERMSYEAAPRGGMSVKLRRQHAEIMRQQVRFADDETSRDADLADSYFRFLEDSE